MQPGLVRGWRNPWLEFQKIPGEPIEYQVSTSIIWENIRIQLARIVKSDTETFTFYSRCRAVLASVLCSRRMFMKSRVVCLVSFCGALNCALLLCVNLSKGRYPKKTVFFLGYLSQMCLPTHPFQGFCEIWEHKRWIFVRPEIVIFIWETVPPPTHVWEKSPKKQHEKCNNH